MEAEELLDRDIFVLLKNSGHMDYWQNWDKIYKIDGMRISESKGFKDGEKITARQFLFRRKKCKLVPR